MAHQQNIVHFYNGLLFGLIILMISPITSGKCFNFLFFFRSMSNGKHKVSQIEILNDGKCVS